MKLPAPLLRVPFLAAAIAALAAGISAGLSRTGFAVPVPHADILQDHGPLMVAGFLATLIGLERAVAHGAAWAYLVPATTAAGGLALLRPALAGTSPALFAAGGLGLAGLLGVLTRRQPSAAMATMVIGALAHGVAGLLLAVGWPVWSAVPWWIAFLLLTIGGERLELTRFTAARGRRGLLVALGVALGAALLTCLARIAAPRVPLLDHSLGTALDSPLYDVAIRLLGAALFAAALWLLARDVVRRAPGADPRARFVSRTLVIGYVWLALSGLLWMGLGAIVSGPGYDAALHAFFVGFAFSMIFAHGPLILPGVLGIELPFCGRFYAHVVLLQLSLVLRLAGDLSAWQTGRKAGAILNAVAIVLFFLNSASAAIQARICRIRDR